MSNEETKPMEQPRRGPAQKNVYAMDYDSVDALRRFVTDTGKILPRRITGLSAKQQRRMTRLVKRSRNMLLLK